MINIRQDDINRKLWYVGFLQVSNRGTAAEFFLWLPKVWWLGSHPICSKYFRVDSPYTICGAWKNNRNTNQNDLTLYGRWKYGLLYFWLRYNCSILYKYKYKVSVTLPEQHRIKFSVLVEADDKMCRVYCCIVHCNCLWCIPVRSLWIIISEMNL